MSLLLAAVLLAGSCSGGSESSSDAVAEDAVSQDSVSQDADGASSTTAPVGDDSEASPTESASTAPEPDASEASEVGLDPAELVGRFDVTGDGVVTIGVAAAGPADDGAYYQAVVDAAREISAEYGFGDPIVVDEIEAVEASTALADLASQVDIVIVGAESIAESLPDLTEQFSDVFWYCNCGVGFPETPGLAQSADDASEVAYTAGVAAALQLEEVGKTSAVFIGCCDLGFEKEFFAAFELGMSETNNAMTAVYVPTGDFLFDFNNVANAVEALNTAAADPSLGLVLPYLGGAHRPVVQAANDLGIATTSAGLSSVCDPEEDLLYDVAIGFDGGEYVQAVFPLILSGALIEGETKRFRVGVDPEPGAFLCDGNDEQQIALDEAYARIAAGELAEQFGAIKAEAYAS